MMITMDRIELNPKVCNGKPVIKGTRIPVSVILEQIAEGETWDELLAGYPEMKDPAASHGVSTNDIFYLNAASCGEFNPADSATLIAYSL